MMTPACTFLHVFWFSYYSENLLSRIGASVVNLVEGERPLTRAIELHGNLSERPGQETRVGKLPPVATPAHCRLPWQHRIVATEPGLL